MRRLAWGMLLVFVFAIPWEYSLDLAAPWGNIARIAGLIALLVAVPAVLRTGRYAQARTDAVADVGSVSLVLCSPISGQLCRT